MIDFIEVCNFKAGTKVQQQSKNVFILNTCQRTLIVGVRCHPEFEDLKSLYEDELLLDYNSSEAYQFLLEIICGLKSKLAGESEIINQFKEAYEAYLAQGKVNTLVMKFMEKLFQDAKKIRHAHLNNVHQVSYASLSRSIIRSKSDSKRILILGTGKLAEDLVKTLTKRYSVYIIGRNKEKLAYFNETYQTKILSWGSQDLISEFSVIINTISNKIPALSNAFFSTWHKLQESSLMIDLSSPSILPTEAIRHEHIYTLEDVFQAGAEENISKNNSIRNALIEIEKIVEKRKYTFTHQNYNSWDELAFC